MGPKRMREHAQSDGEQLRDVSAFCAGRTFIVVSNREPYEHVRTKTGITVRRPAGGLISALDPVLRRTGGTWIAWGSGSADRDVVDARDGVHVPPEHPAYRLRRVWLSEEEIAGFYEGQVNQTLWPLFHWQMENVRFLRQEWDTYQHVNRRFAECVAEEAQGEESIVWFQDYHFATAPAMLRDLLPSAIIAQFWHIPWPPWEIFRIHPQRHALLEGMLGCDLIGMHLEIFCENFLDCVHREFGYPVDFERLQVVVGNRVVRLMAAPISIDARQFDTLARHPETEKLMERMRERHRLTQVQVGLGVERADYTKGILERLRALELFFELHPEWRQRFTFVQVSSPSRNTIPAYRMFVQQVQSEVRRINRRFGIDDWQPIVLLKDAQTQNQLVALYRLADVAIVSSRQDGMNLVAKEYIAAQVEEDGVLLLSEFAGASEEMLQATLINPYNVEGFAHAIHQALEMPVEKRRLAMRQMRDHIFSHTIEHWMTNIFGELRALSQRNRREEPMPAPILDHLDRIEDARRSRPFIELFCDYDGVISPISPRPQDADLDGRMRELLTGLRNNKGIHVNIISGRTIGDVAERVGIPRLTYAGNHGLEIRGPRIERVHPLAFGLRDTLRDFYVALRDAMRVFPGAIVEDKELSLTVHYRLCEPATAHAVIDTCYALFDTHHLESVLKITTGKKVVEFRPAIEWDKGRAVRWILRQLHGPHWAEGVLPIYLGDDQTDEDAFTALQKEGFGIHVGGEEDIDSTAPYRLGGVDEVAIFLDWLLRLTASDTKQP